MPPDAGQQAPADAQKNGRDIASAVERGIANHDLSQAIQLIQQTERNLAGKPQDLKSALEVANRELERSQNPTVQKYFARRDITGTDPTNGGLVLIDQEKGGKVMVGRDGQAYSLEKPNAVREERTTTREGHELVKYTSPDGKQSWEVTRARQADGSMKPYKIVRPDGTSSLYLWERMSPNGPVEPVGYVDVDSKGQAVRNYELAKRPDGGREPGVWQKLAGPPNDFPRINGKLEVGGTGIHRFTMERYRNSQGQEIQANQLLTMNPDGTMKKEPAPPKKEAPPPGQGAQPPGQQQRR